MRIVYSCALALISPAIVTQPESINGAIKNSTVNFTVIASGQPLNYQWYMVVDGPDVPISRATQATLTFEGVTEENEGMYFCFISNLAGNITTATISLSICEYSACVGRKGYGARHSCRPGAEWKEINKFADHVIFS